MIDGADCGNPRRYFVYDTFILKSESSFLLEYQADGRRAVNHHIGVSARVLTIILIVPRHRSEVMKPFRSKSPLYSL